MNWPLIRLIAGQICIHSCMTGLRMAAPLLALREGYSPAAVGFLLALFAITQVVLALPSGRLADRRGVKLPVAYSVGAAFVGAAVAAAFPVFPALCVAALLAGGATGTAIIALQRHVGRTAHNAAERKAVFSWLALGPSISNFIGPFCAGLMIDHAGGTPDSVLGYRWAFALLALFPLLAWLWVRNTEELPPVEVPALEAGAKKPKAWDLLADPSFRHLMLVNWLVSSCWDIHTFVVPLIGHERGLSASSIGAILGVFAMATAAIRIVMPFVASNWREHVVVVSAMLATALAFAIYPFMGTALTMGLCSIFLGLALGSVQPMVMSMLHHITPEHRHGEALGLRMMAINGSSAVMPILFGSVGALLGAGGLFWIAGAGVGMGSRFAWLLGRREEAATPAMAASAVGTLRSK